MDLLYLSPSPIIQIRLEGVWTALLKDFFVKGEHRGDEDFFELLSLLGRNEVSSTAKRKQNMLRNTSGMRRFCEYTM